MCSGAQDTARVTIAIQDIIARAGEKVNIVPKSNRVCSLSALRQSGLRVRYNKSILYNEQTMNACAGMDDSCVMELTVIYHPQSDELISIPCVVTLWHDGYFDDIDRGISVDKQRDCDRSRNCRMEQLPYREYVMKAVCGSIFWVSMPCRFATRPNPAKNSMKLSTVCVSR